MACEHPVAFLKPNWLSVVAKKSTKPVKRTVFKHFRYNTANQVLSRAMLLYEKLKT